MKRMLLLMFTVLTGIMMVGCEKTEVIEGKVEEGKLEDMEMESKEGRFENQSLEEGEYDSINEEFSIILDKETGCKYIKYRELSGFGGVTPLMNQAGKPDCSN